MTAPPVALTIAGSDPSGGAGLQADLKTFHRHGAYGTSVITLITVQNTRAVSAGEILRPALVVAQLAENAANAIGANPLLARVCALFHDIGKTEHPNFFTENQRDRHNPHDDLDPVESARIIKRHVSDGVELAARHRLPRAVGQRRSNRYQTLFQFLVHQAPALLPRLADVGQQ